MIKKVKRGYVIYSKTGKEKLSRVYRSRAAAVKRLRQIELFRHRK